MPSVVITGASSGIGRACARALDARGFRVFAGYRKPADADMLRREGSGRVTPVRIDVTDDDVIRDAARTVAEAVGDAGLDALVNNAGIAMGGPLEFLPLHALRRQLEVNVVGQLAVTQALLPLLRRARGRILNMGSIAGRSPLPFVGAYAMSKHALEAMTDVLRMELRPTGIQVIILEPGAIATPIWETSIAAADELARELPPEAERYYGHAMDAVRRVAADNARTGASSEKVAAAVVEALTARRPRTRRLIGRDARIRRLLAWLPDRVRDAVIAGRLRR